MTDVLQDDLAGQARRLRAWAVESALPLWSSIGLDRRLGGFHERLHLDGSPDESAVRRVRVQARQIYVYAHAAVLGWAPEGREVALAALDPLLRRYRSPDGAPGFVHTLRPDGAVESALRDAYDHAFILLALAWLARASGDAQVRALVDGVLMFLDEHLAAGDGTFHEGLPPSEPRRQNPHMHLFEAMLALHETIGHPQALARAAGLRALLGARFIDSRNGTLGEYFTADWRPWSATPAPIEPGHHAEWSWLLRRHARLARLAPDPLAGRLLDVAVRAADARTGLLPDEILPDGARPSATRRCWPQTELAKAWLAEREWGNASATGHAARALGGLWTHYLTGAVPGAWIDQVDAAGAPLAQFIPASTFYHLFGAIVEADRLA